jgi:hypothetical protein
VPPARIKLLSAVSRTGARPTNQHKNRLAVCLLESQKFISHQGLAQDASKTLICVLVGLQDSVDSNCDALGKTFACPPARNASEMQVKLCSESQHCSHCPCPVTAMLRVKLYRREMVRNYCHSVCCDFRTTVVSKKLCLRASCYKM